MNRLDMFSRAVCQRMNEETRRKENAIDGRIRHGHKENQGHKDGKNRVLQSLRQQRAAQTSLKSIPTMDPEMYSGVHDGGETWYMDRELVSASADEDRSRLCLLRRRVIKFVNL